MFEGLKKFRVVTPFNGYAKGTQVAFNGADANRYAAYIVSAEKAVPVIAPVVEAVKKTVKTVKKGRK